MITPRVSASQHDMPASVIRASEATESVAMVIVHNHEVSATTITTVKAFSDTVNVLRLFIMQNKISSSSSF